MNKAKYCLLLYLSLLSCLAAQTDRSQFIERVNQSYYTLSATELKNFSVWISSNVFREKTDEFLPENFYPLEMIWSQPDQIYFIQRPVPFKSDSVYQIIQDHQISMQKELKAVFLDWQRFCAGSILSLLPLEFQFYESGDTVIFSFENDTVGTEIVFGRNGMCLKIKNVDYTTNQTILTYPSYTYVNNLLICIGWVVQMMQYEQIKSGYAVKLTNEKVNNFFLPSKMILQLQTEINKDQVFVREYVFGNIRINRALQIFR